MRFAWLRDREGRAEPASTPADRATLIAYNLVWWVPLVLPVVGLMSYRSGLIVFLVVTVFRAVVNAYRVNLLPVERAERLPLRSP